jgi:hypothetical protein
MLHPEFELLGTSWELALRADGYADNTVPAYQNAVRSLAAWLSQSHDGVGPAALTRDHVRGWLVYVRETHSASTARAGSPGCGISAASWSPRGRPTATEGVKTPAPGEPETPVLSAERMIKRRGQRAGIDGLHATCFATPGRTPSGRPAETRAT